MTMPIPDGSVVITPRQMYDEIQGTRKSVDRLTSTLDPALSDIRSDVTHQAVELSEAKADVVTLATRVTIVETKLRVAYGALTFAFVALGGMGTFVGIVVSH